MRKITLALAATMMGLVSAASATELKPLRPTAIHLGNFRGTAYYTAEKDGYRVVTTLMALKTEAEHPQVIRFVTTLNSDQTVNLSTPGWLGSEGQEMTISFKRSGDRVDIASAQ